MKWPIRRRRSAVRRLSLEGLDGHIPVRLVLDGIPEVRHVIRHEPIPAPVRANVLIKRADGSQAWYGHITPGRGMLTSLRVPLSNIDPRFSPTDSIDFEFRWER